MGFGIALLLWIALGSIAGAACGTIAWLTARLFISNGAAVKIGMVIFVLVAWLLPGGFVIMLILANNVGSP